MVEHPKPWIIVGEVAGPIQAEILRGLLEAQGVTVQLEQEGAGRAYGLALGPLGTVRIRVPADEQAAAETVLRDYEAGNYDSPSTGADLAGSGEDLL